LTVTASSGVQEPSKPILREDLTSLSPRPTSVGKDVRTLDYKTFKPYFDLLMKIESARYGSVTLMHELYSGVPGLCKAWIHGGIQSFREHHLEFLEFLASDIEDYRTGVMWDDMSAQDVERIFEKIQIMISKLEEKLP
jgi:hypothetical protein